MKRKTVTTIIHTGPLFQSSNILTLRDLHMYLVSIHMYRNEKSVNVDRIIMRSTIRRVMFVRCRNHFPVVPFQNHAHIRSPHGTGQVFGEDICHEDIFGVLMAWGAAGAQNLLYLFFSYR